MAVYNNTRLTTITLVAYCPVTVYVDWWARFTVTVYYQECPVTRTTHPNSSITKTSYAYR